MIKCKCLRCSIKGTSFFFTKQLSEKQRAEIILPNCPNFAIFSFDLNPTFNIFKFVSLEFEHFHQETPKSMKVKPMMAAQCFHFIDICEMNYFTFDWNNQNHWKYKINKFVSRQRSNTQKPLRVPKKYMKTMSKSFLATNCKHLVQKDNIKK